jgi:hypothetical protein
MARVGPVVDDEDRRRPDLYPAAKAMFVYSAIAVIPTTIGLFFSVYGDPGPNCVPV